VKAFVPKTSILSASQKALWPELAPAARLGWVLYGGTAIALRIGHRRSVDFDFFTDRNLDKRALHRAIPILRGAEVLKEAPDTLIVSVRAPKGTHPVKLSFFGSLAFGRFGEPGKTRDGVLVVASLDDLMATKIKALFDRAELKDYQDLAALVENGVDTSRAIAIAREMFPGMNPQAALTAMTYHADVPKLGAKARRVLIEAATAVRSLPEVTRASAKLG